MGHSTYSFNTYANHKIDSSRPFSLSMKTNAALPILLASSLIISSPSSSFGATSASQLYSQAEASIVTGKKQFQAMDKSWGRAQREINDVTRGFKKQDDRVKFMVKGLIPLNKDIKDFQAEMATSKLALEAEIEALSATTVTKYQAAEAAAETGKNPSATAGKFKAAQREAALTDEETRFLKALEGAIDKVADISSKMDKAVTTVDSASSRMTESIETAQAGGLEMVDGIDKVKKLCLDTLGDCSSKANNGLSIFQDGKGMLSKSVSAYKAVSDESGTAYGIVSSVVNDLDQLSNQITSIADAQKVWEEENKNKLRLAKTQVNMLKRNVAKSLSGTLRAEKEFNDAKESFFPKGKSSFAKNLQSELSTSYAALAKADKIGKASESSMREAKRTGDREAAATLKKYSPKTRGSALTATSSALNQ